MKLSLILISLLALALSSLSASTTPTVNPVQILMQKWAQGVQLIRAQKYEEATKQLEKTLGEIQKTPEFQIQTPIFEMGLASLHLDLGNIDKSWPLHERVIQNYPSYHPQIQQQLTELIINDHAKYDLREEFFKAAQLYNTLWLDAHSDTTGFLARMDKELQKRKQRIQDYLKKRNDGDKKMKDSFRKNMEYDAQITSEQRKAASHFRGITDGMFASAAALNYMRSKRYKRAAELAKEGQRVKNPLADYVAGSLALDNKTKGVDTKKAIALLESASQLGNVLATRKLYDHFSSKGKKTEATIYVGLLKHQLENLPVYIESQAGISNLELKTEEVIKWNEKALNELNPKQKESMESQLKKKIESSNKALSEHQIHSLTNAQRGLRGLRFLSNRKACMANQKVLLGALEMFSLDNKKEHILKTPKDMELLVEKSYLRAPLFDPGTRQDTSTYHSDKHSNVWCDNHGPVMGECLKGAKECEESLKNYRTDAEMLKALVYPN